MVIRILVSFQRESSLLLWSKQLTQQSHLSSSPAKTAKLREISLSPIVLPFCALNNNGNLQAISLVSTILLDRAYAAYYVQQLPCYPDNY